MEVGDIVREGVRASCTAGAWGRTVTEEADERAEGCEGAGSDANAGFDIRPDGDLVGIVCRILVTFSELSQHELRDRRVKGTYIEIRHPCSCGQTGFG